MIDKDFAKYGLQTLHLGPNMVKAILKIASQRDVKKHECRGKQNKLLRDIAKKENVANLQDIGINVKNWFNVDGIFQAYFKYTQTLI